MYCGGAVIIRQAIQLVSSAVNLDNLMELARAALDANNPKEAYDYFTKVLEHDPKNPSAWAGKGEAAGWMSTLGNFRLTEMLAGLNNAISYADDESQSLMCERCSNTVNTVAMACFSLARNHVLEFAGVEGAWVEYLDRCETIVAALEAGLSFDPSSRTAIENIILICVRNAEGLSFKNYDNLPSSLFVSEQYESVLRARIDKYSATMKLLNPGFTKPVIQKVSSSAGWDFLRALSG